MFILTFINQWFLCVHACILFQGEKNLIFWFIRYLQAFRHYFYAFLWLGSWVLMADVQACMSKFFLHTQKAFVTMHLMSLGWWRKTKKETILSLVTKSRSLQKDFKDPEDQGMAWGILAFICSYDILTPVVEA
jgi:hypothetical protein